MILFYIFRFLQFHPEGSRIYKLVQTRDYKDKNRDYKDFYESEVEIYSTQGRVMLSDTATRATVFPLASKNDIFYFELFTSLGRRGCRLIAKIDQNLVGNQFLKSKC